eukprot:g2614.t1
MERYPAAAPVGYPRGCLSWAGALGGLPWLGYLGWFPERGNEGKTCGMLPLVDVQTFSRNSQKRREPKVKVDLGFMGAAASKAEEAQPQPEEAPPVQHVPGTSISEKEWHTTQAQTASPDSESSTEVHWREAKTASFPSAASPTLISLASGTANLAASPPTLTSFASESGPTFMSLASGTSPPLTSVASGSTDVPASSSDREVAFNPQSQSLHLASLSRKELRDHLAALFKAAEDNRRDEMARILGIEQGPEPKVEPSKVEVFDRVHPTRGTIPHARRLFGVEFEREDLSRQLLKGVAESKIDVVEKALKGRAVLSHLRKTGWKRARFKDLDDLDKLIKQLQNDKKRGLNKLHEEKSKLEEKIQNCEAEEERKQLSSKLENILVKIGTINRQIEQKEKEKNELLQKYTCDICKEFLDEAVKTKCGRYCWDCWQDWANNKYWTQDNRSNKPLCPNPIDCSCRGTCEPMESEREEINKLKVIKACEFRCGESGWESVDAKKESKKYCSLSEYKKHRDQCEKNPGREQRKEEAPPIVMMWPDLCLQDGEGQDALYKAAGMGKIKIVKMLIEAVTNADPKKRAELLGNRYSCRRWISLLRVSKGSLRSPLHVASRGGHLQVVGLLLKEQADLRAFTQSGSCPLSYAVQNKDWLMTHMLLVAGSDITTESLNDLKMTQNPTWFPKLLNAEEEKAPLVVAIRSNYRIEEVAKKLSNATKDEVNDSLLDGTTPLLAACSKPSEDEAKWLVQSLVEKNADVNKPGFINNSPLLAACEKGHFKLALYLLKAGSRWDEQDVEGRTPLSVLSWRSQDADDLVEYLQLCLKIFSIPEKEIKTFDQLENYAELGSGMFGVVVEAKYTGQAHAVKFPITTKNQKIRHLRRSTEDGQYSVSSNPDQKPGLSATTAPYPKRLARNTPHDEKVFTRPSSMPVDTLATASPFGSRSSEFYLDVKHEPSTASPQNRESNERRRIYSEFLHEALICTRVG